MIEELRFHQLAFRTTSASACLGLSMMLAACAHSSSESVANTQADQRTVETPLAAPKRPPFVFYQMAVSNQFEVIVDQVLLDPQSSQCFSSRRRSVGAIPFERGRSNTEEDVSIEDINRVVSVWKKSSTTGAKPTVVLHGYADHEEVDTEEAARHLSTLRAQTVADLLAKRGVARDQMQSLAHGWDLSPRPIVPFETLSEHRSVEISYDSSPPSEAKLTQSAPVDSVSFREVLERAKGLGDLSADSADRKDSVLAPRVTIRWRDNDGSGVVALNASRIQPSNGATQTDLASPSVWLHRYFLRGLSAGCLFGSDISPKQD